MLWVSSKSSRQDSEPDEASTVCDVSSPVHAVLLSVSVYLRQILSYSEYKPVRFVPVEHGKGGGSVKEIEEMKYREMGGRLSSSSAIVAIEDSIAPTKISRGRHEKMKIVHNGMRILLNGL